MGFSIEQLFLICKAHVNVGFVTCHLRASKSIDRVAFWICWSSSHSVRALVWWKSDRQTFFLLSAGTDIIYSPHLIPTHPHTVNRIKPTRIKHKWIHGNLQPKSNNLQ